MKKFMRIALVFALAGATLLYTGCTKDYEDDIARINETIAANKADTDKEITAIEGRITEIENRISNLETAKTNLEKAIEELQKADGAAIKRIEALEEARTKIEKDITDLKKLAGENKTAIEGLKEDLKNYATKQELADQISDLKTNLEGQISDLEEAIRRDLDDLQGQIDDIKLNYATKEALNNAISDLEDSIDDVLDGLCIVADRIQSISYVPEYNDGKATFTRYNYNHTATYVFVGTFEVRPASAAAKVVADNAFLRIVPVEEAYTRAAKEGETIPVVIDSYVGAKGYVTVRASVPAPKDLHPFPLIYIEDNKDYAVSLLVAQDEETGFGTEIESSYVITAVASEGVDFAENVYFTKNGEKVDANNLVVPTKKIDYTDSLSYMDPNKYLAFDGYDFAIDIEGKQYTLPEAEEFFGVEEGTFAPEYLNYQAFLGRNGFPTSEHPYVLSADGIDRALQLKSVEDKGMYRFIGYSTLYGSEYIGVAGENTYLTLSTSAIITKHQSAATVAAPAEVIPWDYINYESTDADVEALAVTNPDKNTFAAGTRNEYVIYVKGDEAKTPVAGDVIFTQNGTDNVDAAIVGVPCGDETDITYVYEGEYETASDLYMVSFEFTVEARHADVVRSDDLGEVKGNAKADNKFPVALIDGVLADPESYYGNLPAADANAKALYSAFIAASEVEVTKVVVNGEELAEVDGFSVTLAADTENVDKSTVNVAPGNLLYGATYRVEAKYVAFGVTYSWIIDFTTATAPYGIEIIPGTFVDQNVITITARSDNYEYKVNDCDLRQYVQAYKIGESTFEAEDLMVKFSCTDPEITAEMTPVIPDPVGITPNVAPADLTKAKLTDPSRVEWNTYNKLEMPVRCELYVASTEQILGTLDLILKVSPDPMVKFEGAKASYDRTSNVQDVLSNPIWDGYTVIGCLSPNNIALAVAEAGAVESGTALTGLKMKSPDHGSKFGIWTADAINYTQVVSIAPITEWTVIDGLGTKTMFVDNTTNLAFDATTGVVTLLADQANLNGGSLKVTIPTKLTYQFGEMEDTITVTFIQK